MNTPHRICSVEDCKKPVKARGWCTAHWARWRKYGDASVVRFPMAEKGAPMGFLEALIGTQSQDCICWPFSKTLNGYGQISYGGKPKGAHRVICEMAYGTSPSPKHEAAHSCGNGHLGCVNPNHLRWATHKENGEDMARHGTSPRGERQGSSKLTEADVLRIRKRLDAGASQKRLAGEFGVSRSAIGGIAQGGTWRWLP